MDLSTLAPKHLDPRSLTGPISRVGERLPAADELVASVTSTVGNVGSEIAHQVADLDLPATVADTARRSRRAVARVVPWISPPARRFPTRRLLLVVLLAGTVVGVAVLMSRRSSAPSEVPARDDWSTGSSNGTTPATTADTLRPRDPASTSA
jgi:hypothetical protein